MPRLIKHGQIVEDAWAALNVDLEVPAAGQICTLDQWRRLAQKHGSAVQLEPGQEPEELYGYLEQLQLIAIDFPVFTDGRGFSYARNLREHGYAGELRAVGNFIRDQLTYLGRCGFDAFQMSDESRLEAALASLSDFSEYYQGAVDQPLPLFRRRTPSPG
jgi:uncharacterized protein (DUF934 family)